MDININAIKNQLHVGYQLAVEQGGKLAGRAVKVLKPLLDQIRQDARLAGATVVVANILSIELAVRVANLADYLFTWCFDVETTWGPNLRLANSLVTLGSFLSVMIGVNVSLYQGFKSTLSPMAITGISTAACASYVLFRLWMAMGSGSEG